ncbi:MAG: hypothetical protein ACMUJM_07815 [bacterium]
MAHIFFEKLENRKNTQTLFWEISQFAGQWGSPSSFSFRNTPQYPTSRVVAYYGVPAPWQPIEIPSWKQPTYPWNPIDIVFPLYGVNPSPWKVIEFPDWSNPIPPIEQPVLLYGVFPSPVNPIEIPDIPSSLYPIDPVVTYYGITTPIPLTEYPDIITPIHPSQIKPIDTSYPGPPPRKIDDWKNPISDPEPVTPPRVVPLYGIRPYGTKPME